MGIAHSDLVSVSNTNVKFGIFSMIFTMVTCSRSWKSSLFAPFLIILYHVLVTIGADIQNPLDDFIGQDLFDANRILNIVEICLCVFYSQLGWCFFRVLDIQEWLPLRRKLPTLVPVREHLMVVYSPTTKSFDTMMVPDKESHAHRHWGISRSGPSWMYLIIALIYVLGAVCGMQVVYDQFISRAGDEVMAWLIDLCVPLGAGILFFIYCYFFPDPYVFGPNKSFLKGKSDTYGFSDEQIAVMNKATQQRVIWTVVPVVAFHFIGVLVLGGARVGIKNVDTNWLISVGLFAGFLILLTIIFIGMRMRASEKVGGGTRDLDDSADDYYENMASTVPLAGVSSSVKGDSLGAFLTAGSKQHAQ
jgi:hypothetical protein